MTDSLEVQVLYSARWRRRISEAQGRRREAGSEGNVEQSRDPMDKNRIRGLPGRTSGQVTAKSIAIEGRGGKSGGCAAKAVGLTSGGLRRVRNPRTERFRKGRHRGAEVSRGHSMVSPCLPPRAAIGREFGLISPILARPGGRGWLPTRGSHSSEHARLTHSAPRMMVSLLNGTHCARLAPRGGDRCCVGARSGSMSCGPASFAGRAICATAVPLRIGSDAVHGSCR